MVLYALISDASIGYLFLGGVIPGLLLGIAFMVMNTVIARRRNFPVEPPVPMNEIPRITLSAFPALMLPVILLFGIYGGVMTPTEGAAAAAVYALLASTLIYRSLSLRQLYEAMLASAKATTSVGMLIAGALVFNYVVTIENVPPSLQKFIGGYQLSAIGLPAARQHHPAGPRLPAGGQHHPAGHRADLHSDREGARHRPGAFRRRGRRQHHDRPGDAALRPAAVRSREHDQAAIVARSSARPCRSFWRRSCVLALITFVPDTVLWLPRFAGYKG